MLAFIVISDLLKLTTFKGITKGAPKEKTVIKCPCEKVQAPEKAFEKAFYPKHTASKGSIRWITLKAALFKRHIHHVECGHGGEMWIEGKPVEGYDPLSKTVYQYHGCYWHGCPKCYPDSKKIIDRNDVTREEKYQNTLKRTAELRAAGYRVVETWVCEVPEI